MIRNLLSWILPGRCAASAGLLFGGSLLVGADLSLADVFTDHAVFQRDLPVPVWGRAAPAATVTVAFGSQELSTTAAADGRWQVRLAPLGATAVPGQLSARSGTETVTCTDILVGEVWLASGQSNMGVPLSAAHNAAEVLPKALDPQLRFFRVSTRCAAEPQGGVKGHWETTTPDAAKSLSAVAYFFARDLRANLQVPVGVLAAPWGGTPIQSWFSLEGITRDPPLARLVTQWEEALAKHRQVVADPGLTVAYEQDLKRWQSEVAPAYQAVLKEYNAAKAAGREVGAKPQPVRPEPGNPDPTGMPSPSRRPGAPTVNYNGMIAPLVPYALRGFIWYQGEANGSAGLEYRTLMPRLITDWRERWNQADPPPFLFVQLPANGPDTTPVATAGWPWLREAQLMTLAVPRSGMAITIDVGNPRDVHPTGKEPVGQRLALLARRIAYGQELVASGPLYQGFTSDQGRIRVRFSEIGSGLAIGGSPWYAPGVEPFPGDRLIGFFIAGADKKWVEAVAVIDGDGVVVSSPQVPQPTAVRYGWAASPRCNLANREGLPASPFRTDGE